MPRNPQHRNPQHQHPDQTDFAQPITSFDRLGLPVEQQSSEPANVKEQVAFQMLQLKCLLESAFELEGFNQATAGHHHAAALVRVEYAAAEQQYRSFQS